MTDEQLVIETEAGPLVCLEPTSEGVRVMVSLTPGKIVAEAMLAPHVVKDVVRFLVADLATRERDHVRPLGAC